MRWWRAARGTAWAGLPLTDLALGAVLTLGALAAVVLRPTATHPWSELAVVVLVGPLVLRTRAPLAMALAAALGMCAVAALPHPATSLWDFVGLLLLAFSAGAHLDGRRAAAGLGALLIGSWVLQFASDPDLAERLVTPPVLVGAPALAGWLLARSRTQARALRALAAELAVEKERHAEAVAVAERTRIARELHDVLAHSVSVMVVQAGAAEQLLARDDAALPHVRAIRSTGRETLAELRRSLGLLREDTGKPPPPQPTFADLPALAASAAATITVRGTPPDRASSGLQLAAFRIVQEALTNARRHAPGAAVRVVVDCTAAELQLVVEDDGGPPRTAGRSGHGLIGMAERAALHAGTVVAGPRPDGRGWRVTARLPLPAADPPPSPEGVQPERVAR